MEEDIVKLQEKLKSAQLPEELRSKIDDMLTRLSRSAKYGSYSSEFEQVARYLDWVVSIPWETATQDILELGHVKQVLDSHHYGLQELKDRILEYLSVMILNKSARAPILFLIGLVGTGKTTISKSIAESLGRKFVRIPFGGMSSSLDLRGQSRAYADAEPGQIIKALKTAGSKNPIILLDEIDRVAESARGDIMGVLVELLDPGQNMAFTDHYLDCPVDLSQVMFIATANNSTNISPAVMDRLEPVMMPSYTDEEKIKIAKDYILPRELKNASMSEESFKIDDAVWAKIIRPLGFDAGIRTLERTLQGTIRKVARMIVEGKGKSFLVTEANMKQFLPS